MIEKYQEFNCGDGPFEQWVQDNPNGYVLNTERKPTSKYTFLHRSNCDHLSGLVPGQRPDGYTMYERIKVCSNDPFELLAWCTENRKRIQTFSGYCKRCNPEPIDSLKINYPDEVIDPESFLKAPKQG